MFNPKCPYGLVGCWPSRLCRRCRGAPDGRLVAGPAKRKAKRLAKKTAEAKTIKKRKSVKNRKSVKTVKIVKMPLVVVVLVTGDD